MTRPHPVAGANAIGATIATLIAAVVGFGILPAATGDALNSALVITIPAVVALMGVLHTLISLFTAAKTTTPSSDPKAAVTQADGTTTLEPLVPVSFTTLESFDTDTGRHADQSSANAEDNTDTATDTSQLTFDDAPAAAA